jgi:DNA modification methylase
VTDRFTLHAGDCREVLRAYPDDHFDAVVTDPPYGLAFMGKRWDYDVPGEDVWREVLRVLKPGGHLLAFAGTRTQHRMAVRIEDAGFDIRDMIAWVYGSGFPKSLDVGKAIDKSAGVKGELVGERRFGKTSTGQASGWNPNAVAATGKQDVFAPATDAARQWHGWGTALKPALEPITLARKPLSGTVAANVTAYGTGALNIDGCRVGCDLVTTSHTKWNGTAGWQGNVSTGETSTHLGRWPANLLHDGSDEVLAGFPDAEARFYYCAKASRTDRDEGCDHLPPRSGAEAVDRKEGSAGLQSPRAGAGALAEAVRNWHPTVKPTDLMRYLCRLVTPPDGLVLDPFVGSGSTGKGALLEGFRFVGIDLDPEHIAIATARCQFAVDTVDAEVAAAEAPGAQLTLF